MARQSKAKQLEAMRKLTQLAIEGDYDQVRKLATSHLVTAEDGGGRTVLMMAADADWTPQPFSKCIEYFLHLGADASAADLAGNTAAHVAAGRNNLQMLALLPFEAKWLANKEGVTPLMEAVQKRSWQCVKHLLHIFRHGAYFFKNQKSELLGMRNKNQQTALDIARASGQTDIVSIIELEMPLVVIGNEDDQDSWQISGLSASEAAVQEKLLNLATAGNLAGLRAEATPVNCDLPDNEGFTPLISACKSGKNEVVQLLLELGADVTCPSALGLSCLHCAVRGYRHDVTASLLLAGAYANARAVDDMTPLMFANSEISGNVLISAGADWTLRNSRGGLALAVAKKYGQGRKDLVALLNEYVKKSFFQEPLELTKPEKAKLAKRKMVEDEQRRKREEEERIKQLEETSRKQDQQGARAEHVMISYSDEQKELVFLIKEALVKNNIKVWIDYECLTEDFSANYLHSRGVQGSYAFLMCMSSDYKDSDECQKEADYADQKKKLIVPLLLESKYKPDDWLGFILGKRIYYDFSGKYPFDEKMKELLAILENAKPTENMDEEQRNQEEEESRGSNHDMADQGEWEKSAGLHVMISYSRSQKELVTSIKENLVRNNIKVWVDYECMTSGSTFEMLNEGVDGSYAFLMCMSSDYSKSKNCQIEAEYADMQMKLIVPLLLEPEYTPDGWLGSILGSEMPLDFSGKCPFDDTLAELVKVLEQAEDGNLQ